MLPAGAIRQASDAWPALPLEEWRDTLDTLHFWTQIAGKIRLHFTPLANHWWNCALYVTSRGLTTSAIPYGRDSFEMRFDFVDHLLVIETSRGQTASVRLYPRSVADFYREVMARLGELGIEVRIYRMPVEVPSPIPFDQDETHASYDAEYANRFWRILTSSTEVFMEFRGRFVGKCSPLHFWWGSFDLALTLFSGRPAPEREGVDRITREAYSHECISAGFWPGGGDVTGPAFYSYTAPAPDGLARAEIRPDKAFYSPQMGEFLFMYDDMRRNSDPEAALLAFLQTTYEAGANLAHWDRYLLERKT